MVGRFPEIPTTGRAYIGPSLSLTPNNNWYKAVEIVRDDLETLWVTQAKRLLAQIHSESSEFKQGEPTKNHSPNWHYPPHPNQKSRTGIEISVVIAVFRA